MGFFNMKNSIKIILVIIGALIGAGFASGQEIYLFFFSYGLKGLIGLLISMILLGIIIGQSLKLIIKYDIKNYQDFLDILFRTNKKQKNIENSIKKCINIIINIFVLTTFFIMIAGFGAYLEENLGINRILGASILAILCIIVLNKDLKGVVKANEIIVPILIIFITVIGILNLKELHLDKIHHYIVETNSANWLVSSVLYASYNSILLIPVLITIRPYLKRENQISDIISITTAIMILLSISIYSILIRVDVEITKLEMPAVYVVANCYPSLKIAYGLIILSSIFTTAVSLGRSFLQNVVNKPKNYVKTNIAMCLIAIPISQFGFANLVNLLYPIFGYLGIIQIFKILLPENIAKNIKN